MSDIFKNPFTPHGFDQKALSSIEWINANRRLALSVIGTLTVVTVLTVFFFIRYQSVAATTTDKLAIAQGMLYQGQADQGLTLLNEIIARHEGSVPGSHARLIKAQYLLTDGGYEEAEATVTPLITNGKPKEVVPLAYGILGVIQENGQRIPDAITTYRTFLDKFPDHFMAPRMYESLGRAYELNNALSDAAATYEKLAALYPSSPWSQRAQERIAVISGHMQQGKKN